MRVPFHFNFVARNTVSDGNVIGNKGINRPLAPEHMALRDAFTNPRPFVAIQTNFKIIIISDYAKVL